MKIIKIALAAAILGSSGIIVDARIGSNAVDDKTSSSSTFDTTTADLVDEDDIEHRLLQSVDFSAFNPSVQYSDLSVKWARLSERGPTITGHFMFHVQAALFDAWACYRDGTTGIFIDIDGLGLRNATAGLSNNYRKRLACLYAMYDAAHTVIMEMGHVLLNQKYLEDVPCTEENPTKCNDPPEVAVERLEELITEAFEIRNAAFDALRTNTKWLDKATVVSQAVSTAILTAITVDGSNYDNDYQDTSGYEVKSWSLPVPLIESPRARYNFEDGTWVTDFVTYNATTAFNNPNPGYIQINSIVGDLVGSDRANNSEPFINDGFPEEGKVRLTETYQLLGNYGIFPPAADGGQAKPLTAHWGGVTPISLSSSDELRTDLFGPYNVDGSINQDMVDEARQVVDLSQKQQDTVCPKCRASSEYWELGDEFPYPPGWWVGQATQIAKDKGLDVEESLKLILGVSITVYDAGISSWEMKYYYDSVRPFTVINELFDGSTVPDWRGNQTAKPADKEHWRPYQLRRNIMPPFPDCPSGHSSFSTSAATVMRNLLQTNDFDFTSEEFKSRFDLTDGFNGIPDDVTTEDGNENTTLSYKWFTEAADAAGFSRLLGGIHFMQGNMKGLEMGTRVGHLTLQYLRTIFQPESDLGDEPVQEVMEDIVFGTGKDDNALIAPCKDDGSLVEVYGYYGDDVLVYPQGNCGKANLFGGDGADTFVISGTAGGASIQDFQPECTDIFGVTQNPCDQIEIVATDVTELGANPANGKTIVSVDEVVVFELNGEYNIEDLTFNFVTDSTRSGRIVDPSASPWELGE